MGVLVSAFHVFLLACVLQLSGAAHLAVDVFDLVTLGHHRDGDDEHENENAHDCPPGCPACHHACHSGAALPPVVLEPIARAAPKEGATTEWSPAGAAPSGPPLAAVYRPPRA